MYNRLARKRRRYLCFTAFYTLNEAYPISLLYWSNYSIEGRFNLVPLLMYVNFLIFNCFVFCLVWWIKIYCVICCKLTWSNIFILYDIWNIYIRWVLYTTILFTKSCFDVLFSSKHHYECIYTKKKIMVDRVNKSCYIQ